MSTPFWDMWNTTRVQKVSLWVKSQGITPGHKGSCSSDKPSLWDPAWLRGGCTPRGGSWDKLAWGELWAKQDDWLEGRQRSGTLPPLAAQFLKTLPTIQETWAWFLAWKDPLEKEMATHSSVLAWESPWTEGPGRLRSMGLQRVGYDSAHTHTHTHTGSVWELKTVLI